MKQVRGNPVSPISVGSLSTFAFTSTGASGTITISGGVNASSILKGQSLFLDLAVTPSGGYQESVEYFAIPVSSGSIQIASTQKNAYDGTYLSTASGNAGAGTIYPTYKVGGTLFVGGAGNLNVRGLAQKDSNFHHLKNIAAGDTIPFMIKDVHSSGSTASGLIGWTD